MKWHFPAHQKSRHFLTFAPRVGHPTCCSLSRFICLVRLVYITVITEHHFQHVLPLLDLTSCVSLPLHHTFYLALPPVSVYFREVKVTEVKPKEAQLSVERVPGTLSTASKSVQVNGAATVSHDFFFSLFSPLTCNLFNAHPHSDISITDRLTSAGTKGVN